MVTALIIGITVTCIGAPLVEKDMQKQIEEILVSQSWRGFDDMPLYMLEAHTHLLPLIRDVGAERLFAYVLIVGDQVIERERDEKKKMELGMWAKIYTGVVYLHTRPDRLIPEIVPLLANDAGYVAHSARTVLREIDKGNFHVYVAYLKERGEDVPNAFYSYIYASTFEEQAMFTLAEASEVDDERMRELRWKSHQVETARWRLEHGHVEPDATVVEEGRKALAELAADEAWWARAYAAKIASDGRPGRILSDDAIREKLRTDEHPLVAEFAKP